MASSRHIREIDRFKKCFIIPIQAITAISAALKLKLD